MNKLRFAVLAAAVVLVTACSKKEPAQPANPPPLTDTSTLPAPTSATSSVSKSDSMSAIEAAIDSPDVDGEQIATVSSEGMPRYVDHTKDKVEFALKRSLAGAESLLEDVNDPDQASKIKQQIAELHTKLDAL
ncbi:MAG: hypothetical protein ACI915_001974 [Gammaproteobacteria bacterium]|jgi:hypothetical protein